jgi:methyl-accepting chemotaxis protein
MIKLNRIGNKLGVAGVLGIIMAVGMVAVQQSSQSGIHEANRKADNQIAIRNEVLIAEVELQKIRLGNRGVRLARTEKEIESADKQQTQGYEQLRKHIDAANSRALRPETKDRFARIMALADDYMKATSETTKLQREVLSANERRNKFATDWRKDLETAMAAAGGSNSRGGTELTAAEAAMSTVRAAVWRYSATAEDSLKETVANLSKAAEEALGRAKAQVSDPSIDRLQASLKGYMEAASVNLTAEGAKTKISTERTAPTAEKTVKLMDEALEAAEKFTVAAKAEAEEQMQTAGRIVFTLGIAVVATLIASVVFGFLGVARPVSRLNTALGRLAAGEVGLEIPGSKRGDEVGDMARNVVIIGQNAERKAREEAEAQARAEQIAAEQRKRDMHQLADSFESAVGEIVETVSSASTELEASAGTLTDTAERAQHLTNAVAAASEEASTNVQSVASATEELSSSVTEISRQVQDSARIAAEAVTQAERTNQRVSELAKAAARIGDVVELINTIAGQTNLLALNATIEAARAGDAGKGFAVVATEVKALADQTAKATGEISQQISSIQAATHESVSAIQEIGTTIAKMSEIAATIASAVEEQGAATQEISRNVQQAAVGTQEVSSNITGVQRGASETGSASSQVLSAAQQLSGESNRLKLEVSKFLATVRAA